VGDDFAYVGVKTLTALGVLALLHLSGRFHGQRLRREALRRLPRAVTGAVIGAVVGFLRPARRPDRALPRGGVGELFTQRHLGKAGRAGIGATLGLVLGVAAKLAIAFTMLGYSRSCVSPDAQFLRT